MQSGLPPEMQNRLFIQGKASRSSSGRESKKLLWICYFTFRQSQRTLSTSRCLDRSDLRDWHVTLAKDDGLALLELRQIFGQMGLRLTNVEPNHAAILDYEVNQVDVTFLSTMLWKMRCSGDVESQIFEERISQIMRLHRRDPIRTAVRPARQDPDKRDKRPPVLIQLSRSLH